MLIWSAHNFEDLNLFYSTAAIIDAAVDSPPAAFAIAWTACKARSLTESTDSQFERAAFS